MSLDNLLTGLGATGPAMFAVALAAAYFACQLRLQIADRTWPGWRSLSFAGGCLMMSLALAPPFMHWAHEDLRGHMLQHLILGMLAPIGLVLGAPITLALQALPRWGAKLITRLLATRWLRWVTHPIGALILNVGGMYLLYLSPLYAASLDSRFLQGLLHVHFLVAGYLFSWAVLAGPDLAPRRPSLRLRALVLFAAIALHAVLAKLMVVWQLPVGVSYPPAVIESAAKLMFYGGDLTELLLAAIMLGGWYRQRVRQGRSFTDLPVPGGRSS
ncbi:putative membrane protein [Halopseudomonas xinjiangensis]|uniref:Putative membrane protein n=1 Tax=Halopseudomonas xinjiangensis TaxID=487184 RepID=A0A1H1LED9_9GAMM|nr:cytochrome c oxidase assembly protein [Halopseudomonas xinjiangensis]SDR72888.1 putative membrane protein [Halopseudomonas xinjiangensis]